MTNKNILYVLRNGLCIPSETNGPGVFFYKTNNTGLLAMVGSQNSQNIGFFSNLGGWGFTYDAIYSRVGIGNSTPNAPLAFGAVGGKKITLNPGTTGDVGFAVAPNRLQIYSDNTNADVAFGYDAGGVFNERFSIKPNGALALMGIIGSPGQVLMSNGNNAASWSTTNSNQYANTVTVNGSGTLFSMSFSWGDIPGMSYTFNATGNVKTLIQFNVTGYNSGCSDCSTVNAYIGIVLDANTPLVHYSTIPYDGLETFSGSHMFQVGAGSHTIKLQGMRQVSSSPSGKTAVVQFGSTPRV